MSPRSRNSCSMAEFRVEGITYAHSRARPVPSLTSPGYGLPPTITIPARRLINIKCPSRLEPRTFLTGTRALTTQSPTLYRLSYGTGKMANGTTDKSRTSSTVNSFHPRTADIIETVLLLSMMAQMPIYFHHYNGKCYKMLRISIQSIWLEWSSSLK